MTDKLKESPLELLWEKEIIEESVTDVAFAEGNIVAGTKDGWVMCFDLKGELKWKNKINHECLFGLGSEYKQYLKEGKINDVLIKAFEDNGKYLSKLAEIFEKGKNWWEIADDKKIYKIEEHDGELKIYTNSIFSVDLVKEDIIVRSGKDYIFDVNGKIKSKYNGTIYVSDNYILEEKMDKEYFSYFSLFDKNKNLMWKDKIKIKHVSDIDLSNEYIAIGTCGPGTSQPWGVYLFDKDGNMKWMYETVDEVEHLQIFNDKYIGASAGNYYLFDINGKVVVDELGDFFSNIWNGYIATTSTWVDIQLFNINEGKAKWRWEIFRVDNKEELEDHIGKIISIKENWYNDTTYVDPKNIIWHVEEVYCVPEVVLPYILNNLVFAISCDGHIYVFDMEGNLKWEENIPVNTLKLDLDPNYYYIVSPLFFKNYLLLRDYDHFYLFKLKT